jgi:hypothetical protein
MSNPEKPPETASSMSKPINPDMAFWNDVECEDEKHMAIALYLLQKAFALRETDGNGWPTIHACLRDAAAHCEAARLHWTEAAMERVDNLRRTLFDSPNVQAHRAPRTAGAGCA